MEQYDVIRLARVLAVQAEIEGMKAENILRQQNEEAPAWDYKSFSEMAVQLNNLAYCHNEQLI